MVEYEGVRAQGYDEKRFVACMLSVSTLKSFGSSPSLTMSSCLRLSNPAQYVIGSLGPDASPVANTSSAGPIKHPVFETQLLMEEC